MKYFRYALFLFLSLLLLRSSANAQPGAFNPQLLDCGRHGDVEVICGTNAPEDFELTPDGRFLIVAKMGRDENKGLDLFDPAARTFARIPLSAEKKPDWGEDACTESIGGKIQPHGLSFSKRTSGEWQLYVVNHSMRESMEMYELLPDAGKWKLVWRGCVLASKPYNDVAALPDGSFAATRPQALQKEGQNIFAGGPSGNVAVWTKENGERVLPGSEYGYPNGVVLSEDGRYAYISGWATRDLHKYDLKAKRRSQNATCLLCRITLPGNGTVKFWLRASRAQAAIALRIPRIPVSKALCWQKSIPKTSSTGFCMTTTAKP